MNIFYLITFQVFSCIVALRSAYAHKEGVGHNVESYENDSAHDKSVPHIHFDIHHEHDHRGLRNNASSFVIGNQRYANKNVFIQSGNRCGARKPTSEEVKVSTRIVAQWMANINGRRDQAVTVEVQTYFHVITDGANGDISDSALQDQLTVLNDVFREYGFSFILIGTTRTENADWFVAGVSSQDQTDMKTALRVGDKSTLNVYFNRPSAGSLLGYATLPSDYENSPEEDGVVILSDTVPGGASESFNEGKTLVHEVGHWLGLYHTFDTDYGFFQIINIFLSLFGLRNGCNSAGDGVADTPRQRTATSGCPIGKDSCPLQAGLDPINNYMDYSDDACYTEFTPGQTDRMAAMWNEYRA
jgi:Pregnancy-associated plasma protein-A